MRMANELAQQSAALRLQSGFAPPSGNPHQLRFESAMVQYGRQLASRGQGVPPIINHIITRDRNCRSVLLKITTQSCSDRRISRRACVCLFFEICVLVSTRSVLFWKVTGCCLLFRRFTSCLLRAKFSWIAASCSGISFSLLSPTARCAFKFVGAWLWMEHWRDGGVELRGGATFKSC